MRKLIFYTFILILGLNACKPEEQRIIILHTNDMHGKIDNFSKLVSYVKEIEKDYDHVYLLSAGDIFSGNPIVDYYPEKGYPMIDLMNIAGYDVSVLGNHEFDYGQKVLKKRIEQAGFPFICANMSVGQSVLDNPQPSYLIKVDDIDIFILGLIETSVKGKPTTHPARVKGLEFNDPIKTAKKYLEKEAGRNEAFIALSHMGYNNDSLLALACHEIDVIVGGHTHKKIKNGKLINDVLITQAGSYLYNVGRVDLIFKQGKLIERKAKLVYLAERNEYDEKTAKIIEKYNNNEAFQKVVGFAAAPLSGKEELGCFYADAVRAVENTDFAFQNKGGIRVYGIPEGDIIIKTVYELDPFGNKIVTVDLTGDQIKRLLIYAYGIYNEPELNISGGKYHVKLSKNNAVQNILVLKDDRMISDTAIYSVAFNSYMADTYDPGYEINGKLLSVSTTDAILSFLSNNKEINYKGIKRIVVEKDD